jgi:hypothetical protein
MAKNKSNTSDLFEQLMKVIAQEAKTAELDENGQLTESSRKKLRENDLGADLIHQIVVRKSQEKLSEIDDIFEMEQFLDDDERDMFGSDDIDDVDIEGIDDEIEAETDLGDPSYSSSFDDEDEELADDSMFEDDEDGENNAQPLTDEDFKSIEAAISAGEFELEADEEEGDEDLDSFDMDDESDEEEGDEDLDSFDMDDEEEL